METTKQKKGLFSFLFDKYEKKVGRQITLEEKKDIKKKIIILLIVFIIMCVCIGVGTYLIIEAKVHLNNNQMVNLSLNKILNFL